MPLLALVLARPVAAADPDAPTPTVDQPITVTAQACGALRVDEVARRLGLELRTVLDEIRDGPPLQVSLRCDDTRLAITVVDPLTRKRIERDIPAPADEPGRERIVALAVSQLFNASWLELLLPATPPEIEPLPPAPPRSATTAARQVAIRSTTPARTFELLFGAGVRGRSLESGEPFAASRLDVLFRVWMGPSVAIVAAAGWDYGQSLRGLGQIRAQAFGVSGGLGWRYNAGQVAGIGGHILAGSAFARVAGRPARGNDNSAVRRGGTGEIMTGIGPRIRSGRFRLDLDLETGAMLRTPIALVQTRTSDGVIVLDEPVTLGGLWLGAVLRLGLDLRRSG